MDKDKCINFHLWVHDNYWTGYGQNWRVYREKQSTKGALIDSTQYTIEELFDIYTLKQSQPTQ